MSPRRLLFTLAPALGLLVLGVGLGEWSQRQAELKDDLSIPWDEPALKYEFGPGGDQNSFGFNERELPVEKPAGTFRIAALGDSVTHGAFVPNTQSWPRQLENLLNASRDVRGGPPVQALNFGVYGYDTESVAAQLRARVLAWKPDLVVYGFYVNDPMPTELVTADGRPIWVGTGARDFRILGPSLDAGLHRISALFRRFEGAAAARAIEARERGELLDWARFGGWLDALRATAEGAGVPLLVVLIPPHVFAQPDLPACNAAARMGPRFCDYNDEVLQRAAAMAQDRHLPTVDGVAAYRAGGPADLFGRADDPHHPNAEGHRRLAAALAPVVAARLGAPAAAPPSNAPVAAP